MSIECFLDVLSFTTMLTGTLNTKNTLPPKQKKTTTQKTFLDYNCNLSEARQKATVSFVNIHPGEYTHFGYF